MQGPTDTTTGHERSDGTTVATIDHDQLNAMERRIRRLTVSYFDGTTDILSREPERWGEGTTTEASDGMTGSDGTTDVTPDRERWNT